jgi:ParB family transcriptional regulator, chromosome partitioning protein
MQQKRGLGRGLESLIPPPMSVVPMVESSNGYHDVDINAIIPNRKQPRTIFDEEKLRELADSIREQGILQPVAVSPIAGGRYELIAGERRLRAAKLAGLERVPAVIKEVDDRGLLTLSIIENIQREDLNPIEEARALQELAEQCGETHEEIAQKVGKSRVAVANSVRLLKLPRVIQEDVASGRYSAGHARAILGLSGLHEQLRIRERIIREMPTVRDVEKMVQSSSAGAMKRSRRRAPLSPQIAQIADHLKQVLGTKVQLEVRGAGGRLTIDYYSPEDLDRIYGIIAGA